MTCEERLSHAIQIDKIKIYPNSSTVVEKTTRRYIQETYRDRVQRKYKNNEYFRVYDNREEHEEFDTRETHEEFQK
jgi:ribonuclease HI